jgi:hypothetical protein
LPKNSAAVSRGPSTKRLARRGEVRLGAKTVQNVVVRYAEIKLAGRVVLRAPPAIAELHAAVVECFNDKVAARFSFRGRQSDVRQHQRTAGRGGDHKLAASEQWICHSHGPS